MHINLLTKWYLYLLQVFPRFYPTIDFKVKSGNEFFVIKCKKLSLIFIKLYDCMIYFNINSLSLFFQVSFTFKFWHLRYVSFIIFFSTSWAISLPSFLQKLLPSQVCFFYNFLGDLGPYYFPSSPFKILTSQV